MSNVEGRSSNVECRRPNVEWPAPMTRQGARSVALPVARSHPAPWCGPGVPRARSRQSIGRSAQHQPYARAGGPAPHRRKKWAQILQKGYCTCVQLLLRLGGAFGPAPGFGRTAGRPLAAACGLHGPMDREGSSTRRLTPQGSCHEQAPPSRQAASRRQPSEKTASPPSIAGVMAGRFPAGLQFRASVCPAPLAVGRPSLGGVPAGRGR